MTREELGEERYVNLATFRKSGREVRTPVWIVSEGERLCVYTNVTSGKVKRIRNDGRVRLAPCDARGRLRGDWVEGRASMVDDPEGVERGMSLQVMAVPCLVVDEEIKLSGWPFTAEDITKAIQ